MVQKQRKTNAFLIPCVKNKMKLNAKNKYKWLTYRRPAETQVPVESGVPNTIEKHKKTVGKLIFLRIHASKSIEN